METDTVIDANHVEHLNSHATLVDKVRYACEQLNRPTTREVRQWLADRGVEVSSSYVSKIVNTWRKERGIGDTGDLVAMTPELIAALDELRPARPDRANGAATVRPASRPEPATGKPPHTTPGTNGATVALPARPSEAAPAPAATGVADDTPSGATPAAGVPGALTRAAGLAWIIVLGAALGISWWSLFEFARTFDIPAPLAAVVSLVFDASALIVAHLAHRYAVSPDSGAGARLMLVALLAGSVYLNWAHANSKGYGLEASIMFAAPAAVGIILFELHTRWHSRTARRARGRVARPLPMIGPWGWLFHPVQSLTTIWTVTRAHGRVVRTAELTELERQRRLHAGPNR